MDDPTSSLKKSKKKLKEKISKDKWKKGGGITNEVDETDPLREDSEKVYQPGNSLVLNNGEEILSLTKKKSEGKLNTKRRKRSSSVSEGSRNEESEEQTPNLKKKPSKTKIKKSKSVISSLAHHNDEEDPDDTEQRTAPLKYKKTVVNFTVKINEVRKISPEFAGKKFLISWRRGDKKQNSGKTGKFTCSDIGVVQFQNASQSSLNNSSTPSHILTFQAQINQSLETNAVQDKNLLFILKGESNGRYKVIGSSIINLADFVKPQLSSSSSPNLVSKPQTIKVPLTLKQNNVSNNELPNYTTPQTIEIILDISFEIAQSAIIDLASDQNDNKQEEETNNDLLNKFLEIEEKKSKISTMSDTESVTSDISSSWSLLESEDEQKVSTPRSNFFDSSVAVINSVTNSGKIIENNQSEEKIYSINEGVSKIKIINIDRILAILNNNYTDKINDNKDENEEDEYQEDDSLISRNKELSVNITKVRISKAKFEGYNNEVLKCELDYMKAERDLVEFENRERRKLINELQQLHSSFHELKKKSEEVHNNNSSKLKELVSLSYSHQQEKEKFEKTIDDLNETLYRLKEENNKLKHSEIELKEYSKALQQNYTSDIQNEVAKLSSENMKLKAMMKDIAESNQQLSKDLIQRKNELIQRNEVIKSKENEVKITLDQKEELEMEYNALQEEAQTKIQSLLKKYAELDADRNKLLILNKENSTMIAKLESDCKLKDVKIVDCNNNINNLAERLAQTQSKYQKKSSQLKNLRSQIEKLNVTIHLSEVENAKLNNTIENLRNQLKNKEKELTSFLHLQTNTMQDSNNQLIERYQSQIQEKDEKYRVLENSYKEQSNSVQMLSKKTSEFDEAIIKMKKKYNSKKKEIEKLNQDFQIQYDNISKKKEIEFDHLSQDYKSLDAKYQSLFLQFQTLKQEKENNEKEYKEKEMQLAHQLSLSNQKHNDSANFHKLKLFLNQQGISNIDHYFLDDFDPNQVFINTNSLSSLLSSDMVRYQIDDIAHQMIIENIYNANQLSEARKYALMMAKSLTLLPTPSWCKHQFFRIKSSIESFYLRSRYDIEALILCLSIAAHFLDFLQTPKDPSLIPNFEEVKKRGLGGEYQGPLVKKVGIISPQDIDSDNVYEGQWQCLMFDIYQTILLYFESNIDLKGKAGVFANSSSLSLTSLSSSALNSPPNTSKISYSISVLIILRIIKLTINNKKRAIDFNPITVDHLVKMFEDTFNYALKSQLYPMILKQIIIPPYYYLNSTIFHELLGRIEICNAEGGFKVKSAVSYLCGWPLTYSNYYDYFELLSDLENYFSHSLQTANFLITISNETVFPTLEAIRTTFPVLNLAQLKHFLDMYTASGFHIQIPPKVRNEIDSACEKERLGSLPLYLPLKLTLDQIK